MHKLCVSIMEIAIKSNDHYLDNYDIDTVSILKFLGMSCCHMSVYTGCFFTLDSLAYFPKERKEAGI